MALEFSFQVEPDADGVYDGRDLARQMIAAAFRVLTPYVDGCPACSDRLFTRLANDVLATLHEEGARAGTLEMALFATGTPGSAERQRREAAHLENATARTSDLLGQAPHDHDHPDRPSTTDAR